MPFQVVPGLNPIRGAGGELGSPPPGDFSSAAHSIFKLRPPKSMSFPDFTLRAVWCLFLGKILNRGGFRATFLGYLRLPRSAFVFFELIPKGPHMSKGIWAKAYRTQISH